MRRPRKKTGYGQKRRSDRRSKPGRIEAQRAKRQLEPSRGRIKLIARFIAVGLLNTVVGYAIYGILILLNVPYLAALLVSTIAGVIFNYFSIGRLVFKSRGGGLFLLNLLLPTEWCIV